MIPSQESTRLNYQSSRDNYFNITSKSTEPAGYGKPLGLFNPRSKLLFIQRSLQKLSDYQLIGIPDQRQLLFSLSDN